MNDVRTQSDPQASTPPDDGLDTMLREWMSVTERLQKTHESLQREVVRLREELESKDRELERRRRLAALGELAAGVAHEVRNPLGAIQLYSERLRSQCGGLNGAAELIEKIESGIQAIDCVVQDALSLTPRGDKPVPCRVAELMNSARDLTVGALRGRGVRLSCRYDDDDLSVSVDVAAIRRVMVNLIMNAADASPPGGEVRLHVGASDGTSLRIEVIDEGSGLSDEALERIFDPFFTTKEHGTGLGLTIAHRVVEAHGGALTARNREAGGAEFTIELPLSRPVESQTQHHGADRISAA